MKDDSATHAVLPIVEYERLLARVEAQDMIRELNDPATEWIDADDFALQLAASRITKARKKAGLTQKQLGDKLGLPQSQISRIEKNPDRTTVRTLKKIAAALGVNVSALV
ncbi:Antitoxin HipB [Phycisphaerae bacterium RAS1]|nr:Antitoxin HipB [Phycisphaerae bacterium RAS1]